MLVRSVSCNKKHEAPFCNMYRTCDYLTLERFELELASASL